METAKYIIAAPLVLLAAVLVLCAGAWVAAKEHGKNASHE